MALSGFEYIHDYFNKKVLSILLFKIYGLNPTKHIDLSNTVLSYKLGKSLPWLLKKLLIVSNMLNTYDPGPLLLPSVAAQFVLVITASGRMVTEKEVQMNEK